MQVIWSASYGETSEQQIYLPYAEPGPYAALASNIVPPNWPRLDSLSFFLLSSPVFSSLS